MIYRRPGGRWWAGPRVDGHEMRVVEEQRTRAIGSGMGLVSLEGHRLAIFRNGSLCTNWKLLPSHERSVEVTRQIRIHKADLREMWPFVLGI